MKKGVVIGLILFLSLSFVSAGFFSNFWGKITGDVVGGECIDTDGFNIYHKGNITFYESGFYDESEDRCTIYPNEDYLVLQEGYCNEGRGSILTIICSQGCDDGACIGEEQSVSQCIDSDGGKDYSEKGQISGPKFTGMEEDLFSSKIYEDSCVIKGDMNLLEYYCDGGLIVSEGYECPQGCNDGACICTDSDGGKNYYMKGFATGKTHAINDGCIVGGDYSGWLREAICDGNVATWTDYKCPNGCEEGVCIGNCTSNCLGKECGDDGCGGDCGSCIDNKFCSDYVCIEEGEIDFEISIATLKDFYLIGEQINLTDPPENRILENNEIVGGLSEVEPKTFGYIIKFKDEPILVKRTEIEEDAKNAEEYIENHPILSTITLYRFFATTSKDVPDKINDYSSDLKRNSEHIEDKIINKVKEVRWSKITGQIISDERDIKVLGKYENVFNGIALHISEEEAEEIEKLREVEEVYPNYEVKTLLMDSVPLINADDVWELDEDGNDCATSGKDCLTGKGITIGIIDTGIDYTHEDLGGTGERIKERDFEKITEFSINPSGNPFPYFGGQLISFDDERVTYLNSDNKINIYSFQTQESLEIPLPKESTPFRSKLELKDNLLVNFILDRNGAFLYLYDLNSGQYKYIEENLVHLNTSGENNLGAIGSIGISNGNIIYGSSLFDEEGRFYTNIFVYNVLEDEKYTIAENIFGSHVYNPLVSENFISYTLPSNVNCDKSVFIYDLINNEEKEVFPPNMGYLADFKKDILLYFSCDGHYYFYNLTDESYVILDMVEELNSEFEFEIKSKNFGFIFAQLPRGSIGDEIFYFPEKDYFSSRIIAYDLNMDRYVKINILEDAGFFDSSGKKLCFVRADMHIYCHDYNPSYDYPLPEIAFNSKVIGGYDFVNGDDVPIDDNGHGTHVAAIAAGNGILKGVAPDAKLYAYKVLDSRGSGSFANILAAIESAVDPNKDGDYSDHLDVISMSLGASCNEYDENCGPDDIVSTAIDNAVDLGVIAIISAGNSGPDQSTIGSPGTARKAITVAATDKLDVLANFSSRGPVVVGDEIINKPDISAPGVDICSARYAISRSGYECFDTNHVTASGTSMAAPHVAGAVALLKQGYPSFTPDQIKQVLKQNAVPLLEYTENEVGSGRLDFYGVAISGCGNNVREGTEECDGTDDSVCENRCSQTCTCLPQSKIVNNDDEDLSGILLIYVQKYDNENWKNYLKPVSNYLVIVPAKGLIKLDALFNPLEVSVSEEGKYRVYAEFLEKSASWEFSVV